MRLSVSVSASGSVREIPNYEWIRMNSNFKIMFHPSSLQGSMTLTFAQVYWTHNHLADLRRPYFARSKISLNVFFLLTKHSSPIRKHFDKENAIFSNNFSLFAEELCDKHQVTQLFMFLAPNEQYSSCLMQWRKVNLQNAWCVCFNFSIVLREDLTIQELHGKMYCNCFYSSYNVKIIKLLWVCNMWTCKVKGFLCSLIVLLLL